ncbi:MAG: hypothetical protein K0R59_1626 [Sphingobacterium sp.]|jgi:hypothetical protein|nr:hypothetical protein [Sphingobacterium sp.]
MRYRISLILMGLMTLASSCSKFLEETSQSELVPRSVESLNEYLLGEGYPRYDASIDGIAQFLDDDVVMFQPPTGTGFRYNTYTWQAKEDGLGVGQAPWEKIYLAIQTCNTVLDYLPKVSGEQKMKDYVAGQALLLRAYYYSILVNFFGLPYNDPKSDPKTNLAVPLLTNGGVELTRKPRNTVAEVYAQIEKDMLEGIRLIDQSGQIHNNYRIGSEAGHLLASRVYLYMENWDEVIKHTDFLLDKSYKLVDLRTWGPADPKIKRITDATGSETIWAFGTANDSRFSGEERNWFGVAMDVVKSYVSGDLRNGIYVADRQCIKVPKVTDPVGPINGKAFRLSEAYLNRAEALAYRYKQGNAAAGQQSVDLLNQLREKRFSSESYRAWTLPSNSDELLEGIRAERRRELLKEENHRWFDLRRYGMPSIEHVYLSSSTQSERYVLEKQDPAYTLPIPKDALALNPKLIQNTLVPVRQPK